MLTNIVIKQSFQMFNIIVNTEFINLNKICQYIT